MIILAISLFSSLSFAASPVNVTCIVTESIPNQKQVSTYYSLVADPNQVSKSVDAVPKLIKDIKVTMYMAFGAIGNTQRLQYTATAKDQISGGSATGLSVASPDGKNDPSSSLLIYTRATGEGIATDCFPTP